MKDGCAGAHEGRTSGPRLRLLLISRSIPLHCRGGMEHAAWDLARALRSLGVEVRVLTTRIPGRGPRFDEEAIEVRALAGTRPGRYGPAWWRLSRTAYREELAGRVDGILSVSAGGCGLLAEAARPPFVFQVHGTALRDLFSGWRLLRARPILATPLRLAALARELRACARSDAVVAVSAGLAAELARPPDAWVLPRERLFVIPNGIDTRLFRPDPAVRREARAALGLPPDARVVVSASRLHPQKGLDRSLRGFARLAARDPRARYLIAGDGPDRPRLTRLAASLGLDGRAIFTGSLPRERLPEALCAGDVFLFTTLHREGAPLGILEALACGLPAVVSAHLQEPCAWGAPVEPVDPRDPGAIAAALERALDAAARGQRDGGQEGRAALLPRSLALEATARAYLDLFTRLVNARAQEVA